MIFEKKKIQIETLSEYLISVRKNLGFSTADVSQKISIKPKFLTCLEQGKFENLPADIYVIGFLKQLGRLYCIETDVLIEQYKKEKGIERLRRKQEKDLNCPWYKKIARNLVVTPKILSLTISLIFIVLTVGYIIWQVWSINKMPSLNITEPSNNSVINASSVFVRGTTDPGLTVLINGENIFVDSQGFFEKQLGLNPGPKQIEVTAKNRFDKSASQTLNIIGVSGVENEAAQLELKVDFFGPVVLEINIDNQTVENFNFQSGDSKVFLANNKIIVSTSDAGATKVTVNGQSLGSMGRAKESLSNVVFYPQSATSSVER